MEKHFSALRTLAASRPVHKLAAKGSDPAPNPAPSTYQEYVCAVDEFVALLDIPMLKTELSKLATSQQSIDSYLQFLNDLLDVWNLWKSDVHPGFDNSYKKAVKANEKLPEKFTKAIRYLKKLSTEIDEDTVDALLTVVDSMQTQVENVAESIETLTSDLLAFILGFDTQKKIFEDLCAQISKDQGLKEDDIKALEKTISNFNEKIAENKRMIIGLSIADGIALIFGAATIAAAIISGPFMLAAFIVLGPALAIATTFIGIYAHEITKFKDEIAILEAQQGTIKEEIKALTSYKDQFKSLTQKGSKVKTYVEEVKKPWDALAVDLNKIRAAISITDDMTVFGEYLEAFKEAEGIWKMFMIDIEKLKLPERRIAQLPANLKIESQADLERIIRESVNIDDYFRHGRA